LETSIHKFRIEGLRGERIDFSKFVGKKLLLINVASECGFTGQYSQLQELYAHYSDKMEIIAFPCNDFGGQEPGDEDAIHTFCNSNYGISFPITKKIQILGEDIHPIYEWLTNKEINGQLESVVEWNFQKYLVNEAGKLAMVIPSSVEPLNEIILNWISSS
jgi:glutathione peroxidase